MRSALKIPTGAMDLVVQILVFAKSTAVGKNVSWKSLQKIAQRIWEENGSRIHLKIIGPPNLQVLKNELLLHLEIRQIKNISIDLMIRFLILTFICTGEDFSSSVTLQNQDNTVKGNLKFTGLYKSASKYELYVIIFMKLSITNVSFHLYRRSIKI